MLDALRVPLKTIQERIGHALTGSSPWTCTAANLNGEAAQLVGAELEKAVNATIAKLENATQAVKKKGSGALSPKPLNINMFFGCGGRI
jgi:hypothetical protein